MKRRLHERLHPLIGEEEADALLDEISPPEPVTREWLRHELAPRFDRIDRSFEQVERRFEQVDRSFEQVDRRFEQIDDRFEQVDRRFEQVDRRFERIDDKFERIDERFARMEQVLRQQIVWIYGSAAVFAVVVGIIRMIWG